jgi:DNA-binding NarL/FixJ family response regulator
MTERIIIADDHPIFRDGMRRLIEGAMADIEVIEAGTMAEVLVAVEIQRPPDLFILDLLFPGMQPVETIPRLRQQCPKSSIAIVSMMDDEATIDRTIEYGADAYIVKSIPAADMLNALIAVRAGQFVIARPNIAGMTDPLPVAADIMDLTQRQREILSLIKAGQSNKEIGRALALSHFTVRNHVSLLLRILRVHSRSELASKAAEYGN